MLYRFAGDTAELGIIRAGTSMKVKVILNPRVNLVPFHIDEGQPSYLIIAGLVFTPLSEPYIEEEHEDTIGLKLLAKARYSFPKFKGEQIVILSQVIKFNGVRIKNIQHLAHLIDSCKDKYMCFEFEDCYAAVLLREDVIATTTSLIDDYGIQSERSPDLQEPYVDSLEVEDDQPADQEFGDTPVSNNEVSHDGLFWA
ncbi:protease Do-like chloroplastic-like [Trifolium pratense]|uniref:Protease Do-like chloroplastic-like n=1 Tax=Trifolium pratense TaxID=57577 RepID=A0A2K3N3G9_TRIPR|nr:protease Do-like chloroplastic-like [Trifolium pratense]